MITSDAEGRSATVVEKGKQKAEVSQSSRLVPDDVPLFLEDDDESEMAPCKRVFQESPSRVQVVQKRSRTLRSSELVATPVPVHPSGPSDATGPPSLTPKIDLGHLTVNDGSPLTKEILPGLQTMVSPCVRYADRGF